MAKKKKEETPEEPKLMPQGKKKKAVDPRGRDVIPKFSTAPIQPAPEVGVDNPSDPRVPSSDRETPILNQAGEPFNFDEGGDAPGTGRFEEVPKTSFELLNEKTEAETAARNKAYAKRNEIGKESSLTPHEVMQGLMEGNVSVPEVKGVNDRQTEAVTEYQKTNKVQEMLAKAAEYARSMEGYIDKSPEDWKKSIETLLGRREEKERDAANAKIGRAGIFNDILIGHKSAYPDNRDDLNLMQRRHDTAQFGPGKLAPEEKDRSVTPFAISNWQTYNEDRLAKFMGRRKATEQIYGARATADSFNQHQRRVDANGIAQCGNPDCVAEQAAAHATYDKPFLRDQLLTTFIKNHADKLTETTQNYIDKGHEIEGTRYDENAAPYNQPNHTEEECPFVHPETGSPLYVTDPVSGKASFCTNHATPDRTDSNGVPFKSDWFQTPAAVSWKVKTQDGRPGVAQIPYPGLRDMLNVPEYTEPGGIEDRIVARKLLTHYASNHPEFSKFFNPNPRLHINTENKLVRAVKSWLGSTAEFRKKVINRQVPVKSEITGEQEYNIDPETGEFAINPKTGKKVRTMRSEPLGPLAGKTSFRRAGEDTGLGFYKQGGEKLDAASKSAIAALVDAGLKHYKNQKDLPNDIQDIVNNSKNVQGRAEKAQERISRGKTAFEMMADQILSTHQNIEAANRLSRSIGQEDYAKKLMTPQGAGFVSEGRERGDAQSRMVDNMVQAGDMIAGIAGTITGDTRTFVPPAATGGNRYGSGVPGSMPAEQPRSNPALVEEEPEPPLKNYTTTSAPKAPAPTVKTAEETEADIAAYAKRKAAQRKASKNPPTE